MFLSLLAAGACVDVVTERGERDPASSDIEPDVIPDDPDAIGDDSGEDPDDGPDEDDLLFEALFDLRVVHRVEVELDADDLRLLDESPFSYVEGAAVVEGTRLERVGVRLKGNNSFQDFSGKPALKLRFDKYLPDQRYAGLKRLTLNNMVGDPAQSREVVAYHLWNHAGMSAPRAAFAQVWINGEDFGLYTMLEPMDSEYVERRYEMDEGDLWAANDSAELTPEGIAHYELVTGPGGTELEDAAMVLATAADDYYETASEVIDMEQFLDYFAWIQLVGTLDGYPYNLNDYFLYADPGDAGRFDFSPWGLDEAWDPTWTFQWGRRSTVAHQCLLRDSCRALAQQHLDDAVSLYESADAAGLADELAALTEEIVVADSRRPWSTSDVRAARAELWDMLASWGDVVRRGYWRETPPPPEDTGTAAP
ncbi:MAG: CotH kinase family protein [Myxococcota bacterium]